MEIRSRFPPTFHKTRSVVPRSAAPMGHDAHEPRTASVFFAPDGCGKGFPSIRRNWQFHRAESVTHHEGKPRHFATKSKPSEAARRTPSVLTWRCLAICSASGSVGTRKAGRDGFSRTGAAFLVICRSRGERLHRALSRASPFTPESSMNRRHASRISIPSTAARRAGASNKSPLLKSFASSSPLALVNTEKLFRLSSGRKGQKHSLAGSRGQPRSRHRSESGSVSFARERALSDCESTALIQRFAVSISAHRTHGGDCHPQ